jgi:hypothetical protein
MNFVRTVFHLYRQGRLRDMNDLIDSYGRAHGIDVEELRREVRGE